MVENNLRILVVDDHLMMAKTLVDILRVKGYEAEAAGSGPEALEKVAQVSFDSAQGKPFDCVLTDIKMPDVNGVELCRAIRARQPDLPVVLMTAYSTDKLVQEGLEEGAIAALTKPLDINALLSFFSSIRKQRSIVIVDDDPQFCRTLADILRVRGFAVTQVTDPHAVLESIVVNGQVMLLDMKPGHIDGLELLKAIRKQHPHMPVILVTDYRQEMTSTIEAALEIDAYACLYKPFQIEELLELLTQIRHQEIGKLLRA